jgi:hypothetical protein
MKKEEARPMTRSVNTFAGVNTNDFRSGLEPVLPLSAHALKVLYALLGAIRTL